MCATAAIGVDVVLGNTGLPRSSSRSSPASRTCEGGARRRPRRVRHGARRRGRADQRVRASRRLSSARRSRAPSSAGARWPHDHPHLGHDRDAEGAARKTPGGFGPLISIIERIPLRARDRILVSAPLFHTWGYAAIQALRRDAGDDRPPAPLRPAGGPRRPRGARGRRDVRRAGDAPADDGACRPTPGPASVAGCGSSRRRGRPTPAASRRPSWTSTATSSTTSTGRPRPRGCASPPRRTCAATPTRPAPRRWAPVSSSSTTTAAR